MGNALALHAFNCKAGFSSNRDLLLRVITEQQALSIANELGRERLQTLALVDHGGEPIDYKAASQQEGRDLEELRIAITKVTHVTRPWIIGYASEFATCLLTFI